MANSLDHHCPHCGAARSAPTACIAHAREIYTVTCVCGEKYEYSYYIGEAWKPE